MIHLTCSFAIRTGDFGRRNGEGSVEEQARTDCTNIGATRAGESQNRDSGFVRLDFVENDRFRPASLSPTFQNLDREDLLSVFLCLQPQAPYRKLRVGADKNPHACLSHSAHSIREAFFVAASKSGTRRI